VHKCAYPANTQLSVSCHAGLWTGAVVLDAGEGIGVQSYIGSKMSTSRVHTVLNFVRYKTDWQNHIYKCVYNILLGFTLHDDLLFCILAEDGQVGNEDPDPNCLFSCVFVLLCAFAWRRSDIHIYAQHILPCGTDIQGGSGK